MLLQAFLTSNTGHESAELGRDDVRGGGLDHVLGGRREHEQVDAGVIEPRGPPADRQVGRLLVVAGHVARRMPVSRSMTPP